MACAEAILSAICAIMSPRPAMKAAIIMMLRIALHSTPHIRTQRAAISPLPGTSRGPLRGAPAILGERMSEALRASLISFTFLAA